MLNDNQCKEIYNLLTDFFNNNIPGYTDSGINEYFGEFFNKNFAHEQYRFLFKLNNLLFGCNETIH